MRHFIIAFASFWVLCAASPVYAADNDRATREALSRKYVQAIGANQNIGEFLDTTLAFSAPSIFANTPEIRDNSEIAMQIAEATKQLYVKKISEGLISFYADFYTVEELQALVDFHASPIGQSILSKGKNRSQEDQRLMYELSSKFVEKFTDEACNRLKCQKKP